MKPFECLYVPIGVSTFHLESAQAAFEDSIRLLKSIDENVVVSSEMLLSIEALVQYIDGKNPDLVILQNVTFANSAYATEVLKRISAPILLWTLREPVIDGGRLRLNSLTGAFSAGYAYKAMRKDRIFYIYGSPSDDSIQKTLTKLISAAKLKHEMKNANLLMVGHTPQGFGFGRALDLEMSSTFGVNVLAIESRELTKIAREMNIEDAKNEESEIENRMVGLEKTLTKNRVDFVKLYKAYHDYIEKNNIKAIASRCWPDFFTDYGTPVCSVLAMLNDQNVAAACEADAYGALSMYIGQQFSKLPTYLGDPVSIDEIENTITFWHCGTAACGLARRDTGATVGVHPNRKIGPTMEFGLRECKEATIFRIGRKPDGTFRFLIMDGKVLDKPQQFLGTSVVVEVEPKVNPLITSMVQDGWEPHFVVIYADIKEELELLAQLFGCEIVKY
ncbi:MAG: fucose isomerase [Firmicutes bacterium HGW-Firmicutes-19]|jgi:L-fucose isomerase-like protein|nr:MAG: fucose isomerase [Firmicutes bacterium HGW-Firmicutes-19]